MAGRLVQSAVMTVVWWTACAGPAAGQVLVEQDALSLWVGATEVTQELYERVTGENPSYHRGPDLPVESVSWTQAAAFCNALSLEDGLEPVYGPNGAEQTKNGWRLPTEEEWIVLAKAGGPADLATAWFANNAERRTHSVGRLLPNRLGLYDLFGNVWEWCDSGKPEIKPDHGGGYRSNSTFLVPGAAGLQGPGSWGDDLGFRIVRNGPPPAVP